MTIVGTEEAPATSVVRAGLIARRRHRVTRRAMAEAMAHRLGLSSDPLERFSTLVGGAIFVLDADTTPSCYASPGTHWLRCCVTGP
jgi:hypothetical protein